MPKTFKKFRRTEKKRTRYLVQEREGMDDVIYIYTDALASRDDMHPISEEDAKSFLAELYPDHYEQVLEVVEDATESPEVKIEETGAAVIDSLADTIEDEDFIEVPEPVVPKTDPKNAVGIDREEDGECQLIMSFTKKNQVEHYLLFTHQLEIEITKDSKLADLKEEAISAVIAKRL